jgi:hypothetical protein
MLYLYLLWLRFDNELKKDIKVKDYLQHWLEKNFLLALGGLAVIFSPIVTTLFFVGVISMIDFFSGIAGAKVKGEKIQSQKMIRKFYVVFGYFCGILVAHILEAYFGDVVPMTKAVVAIIAITEIQSVRENITAITGVDILKPLQRILERKSESE